MANPRPEKVAVVDEVRVRLDDAQATVVTEYRGLTVADLAVLRKTLTAAGGDYKVFKNTLVKRAIDGGPYAPLSELLVGPTAIAFVHGDVSGVARALRDFARTHTHLVVKGGLLDGSPLSPAQLGTLADLPSKEVLLARLAGGFKAPLAQLASLLEALPRNLAYGLKALLDERGGAPGGEAVEEPVLPEAAAADEPVAAEPPVEEAASAAPGPEAAAPETAAPDAEVESPEPEATTPETAAPDAQVESTEPEAATPETADESPELEPATPETATPEPASPEGSPPGLPSEGVQGDPAQGE